MKTFDIKIKSNIMNHELIFKPISKNYRLGEQK